MARVTRLTRTNDLLHAGIERGLHIGAQLYVSLRGETIADVAIGEARPGVPMRADTLMLWLSAGKPVTAVAIAQLWQRGLLELDDCVAQHIPEFAAGGKENVTIRHLRTHTGGFRGMLGKWEDQSWEKIIVAVCAAPLEPRWRVGVDAGYHLGTSWYILGEIIRRLDGRPLEQYVRDEIFLPLGMSDCWIGMPAQQYRAYGDRIGFLHDTSGAAPRTSFAQDTEAAAAQCRPGSGARGPARQLGRFYEMLLNRGEKIITSQTADAMTTRQRAGIYDKTFRHTIDFGLGFIIQSNQYGIDTVPYGYGPHASPRTFGHGGARSSSGYCDPEHGLVVACILNGAPTEAQHDARMREINAAIYEDLGLVAG